MIELKYKTRKGSSPHNKPKVFFACYPSDHHLYFDKVSEWILDYQNCTVLYIDPEDAETISEYENVLSDIKTSQLIVFAVTSSLLTKNSFVMEKVYNYALDNFIPILPIVMESDLDKLYNLQFGNLQYLQPNIEDKTQQPFEEKLKNYLSKVLVGDEVAERIRAAFAAYIFLSYRKKDRELAQKLMRMIHNNPKYRDVAIWYDEYITPGKDFSETIFEALRKSQIFALAVTPNILEPGNYVLDKEYAEAVKEQIPVIPFELENTDRLLLYDLFKGLPECVSADEIDLWEDKYSYILDKIAFEPSCDDLQHNYLIGLAYLDGIDVEVDFKTAETLIREAAEAGLQEAAETMAEMYRNGKGVKRDFHKYLDWADKSLGLLKNKWEKNYSEEDGLEYVNALIRYCDDTLSIGRIELAEESIREVITVSSKIGGDYYTREGLLIAYHRLADIAQAAGQYDVALDYCNKEKAICEQRAEKNDSIESKDELAIAYSHLGHLEYDNRRFTSAKACFEKVLQLRRGIQSKDNSIKARQSLALAYDNLGIVDFQEGALEKAKRYHEKSLRIHQMIADETRTIESRRNVIATLTLIGDIEKELGNNKQAESFYTKGVDLCQMLIDETGMLGLRRDLALIYSALSALKMNQQDFDDALGYHSQSCIIYKEIAKETGLISDRGFLVYEWLRIGEIEQRKGCLREAKDHYYKAVKTGEALLTETNDVEIRSDLSLAYIKAGEVELDDTNLEIAESLFRKSLVLREELANDIGGEETFINISHAYSHLGDVEKKRGNCEIAKDYYKKSFDIREKFVRKHEDISASIAMMEAFISMGDINECTGNNDEAKFYFVSGMLLGEKILNKADDFNTRLLLAKCYEHLGDINKSQHKYVSAKEYYLNAIESYERLFDISDKVARDLAYNYYDLGCLEADSENLEGAEHYLLKGKGICEQMLEARATLPVKSLLAAISLRLGILKHDCGDTSSAITLYQRSLQLNKEAAADSDDKGIKRNVAVVYSKIGELKKQAKDYESALQCFNSCLKIIESINGDSEEEARLYDDFKYIYKQLGDVQTELGNVEAAKKYYAKSDEYQRLLENGVS